jgi:hypothetical protein
MKHATCFLFNVKAVKKKHKIVVLIHVPQLFSCLLKNKKLFVRVYTTATKSLKKAGQRF